MPGQTRTPSIMQRCVADVSKKYGKDRAFAICTKSLQKSGTFVTGSNTLTKKGKAKNVSKSEEPDMDAKHDRFEKLLGKTESIKEDLDALRVLLGW